MSYFYLLCKLKLILGYPDQPVQPLIRIRIFYDNDSEQFDTLRFEDITLFYNLHNSKLLYTYILYI